MAPPRSPRSTRSRSGPDLRARPDDADLDILPSPDATSAVASRSREVYLFAALWGGYLAAHLIGRWLAWTLFHGHGSYGWARPGLAETSYLLVSVTLPAALVALALVALVRLLPARRRLVGAAVIALLATIVIESDVAWMHMSESHITWRDVQMFITESWSEHFGLRGSDLVRAGLQGAVHAVVLGALVMAARWLADKRVARRLLENRIATRIAVIVVFLCVSDAMIVGYALADRTSRYRQWDALSARSPLRVRSLDDAFRSLRGEDPDLAAARDALDATAKAQSDDATRSFVPAGPADIRQIVFLVVESFGAAEFDAESMPYLSSLASKGVVARNHHSVGNCTHYGLLGLIHGEPVTFYRGVQKDGLPQSTYIDALNETGFETGFVGDDVTSFRHVGDYTRNFSRPDFRAALPSLVPELDERLTESSREFVLLFYGETHFPYPHDEQFNEFQPEVAADFDFNAWDAPKHRDAIVNRYRNCLSQLDAWIEKALAEVDLEHAIVVITGDHGQEFFENGRLAHGSSLETPQTGVPFVLLAPGLEPREINYVTSHADVMPTVFDLLDREDEASSSGRSIFDDRAGRHVVIAANNYIGSPVRWAVVTDMEKSLFEGGLGDDLELTQLLDADDRPVRFSDDATRWTTNFTHARRLRDTIRGSTDR